MKNPLCLDKEVASKLALAIKEKRIHAARYGKEDPFTRGMIHGVESLARELTYKLEIFDRGAFLVECGIEP